MSTRSGDKVSAEPFGARGGLREGSPARLAATPPEQGAPGEREAALRSVDSSQPDGTGAAAAMSVVRIACALVDRGLVVGSTGNVSTRVAGGYLITPTRASYFTMVPQDLVAMTAPGDVGRASREWRMHAAVYRERPDVAAVVHTHSPYATAWSFLDEPLSPQLEDSEYYDIGTVRTSAWAPVASAALADRAVEALGRSQAVLLGGHGVLAVGDSPEEALVVAEVVERHAQISWLLRGEPDRARCGHGASTRRTDPA